MRAQGIIVLVLALLGTGCFTAKTPERRYYVLNVAPLGAPLRGPIPGLLRVRDLDAESAYDKFQIVVRKNPFELIYRETDVWAVKPGRMISDIIARSLLEAGTFEAVTRELGERRPDYTLSGDLHAVEIYDSDDMWFAHLSLSLQLTRFSTGENLWSFSYDERKRVPNQTFTHAIRALSELLTEANARAVREMTAVLRGEAPAKAVEPEPGAEAPPPAPREPEPFMVPETPAPEGDQ